MKIITRNVNQDTLKILYYTNFDSVLRYGIIFWGGSSGIQSVFVVQKRVSRTICKMMFRDPCRGKLKNMNIPTVYALYIYECLIFVLKNLDEFNNGAKHNCNTRTNDSIYPRHELFLLEKGPHFMGIGFFNKLIVN